jgi:hypothetical protein
MLAGCFLPGRNLRSLEHIPRQFFKVRARLDPPASKRGDGLNTGAIFAHARFDLITRTHETTFDARSDGESHYFDAVAGFRARTEQKPSKDSDYLCGVMHRSAVLQRNLPCVLRPY